MKSMRHELQDQLLYALDGSVIQMVGALSTLLPDGYCISIEVEHQKVRFGLTGPEDEIRLSFPEELTDGELLGATLNVARHLAGQEAVFLDRLTPHEFLKAQEAGEAQSPGPEPSGPSQTVDPLP